MSICGVGCENCPFKDRCEGCEATCGKPFGGSCIAAETVQICGKAGYDQLKARLVGEINELLRPYGVPTLTELNELSGAYVNLEYPIPSGGTVKFLDNTKIYLGAQTEAPGYGKCFGVVADTTFILICAYGENGTDPEIILFKKR